MLKIFRTISLIEGLSYLAILCVTFGLVSRQFVSVLGMSHGGLFMLYLVFSFIVAAQQKWSLKIWLPIFLASLIPLAFVLVELYFRKNDQNNSSEKVPAEQ
jgi:integral membrane protein